MSPGSASPQILRIVEGLEGRVPMHSEPVIRFGYGRVVRWVRRVNDARLAVARPDALCYRTAVDVRGEALSTMSEFTLEPGRRVPFVLTWFPSYDPLPEAVDPERSWQTPRRIGWDGPTPPSDWAPPAISSTLQLARGGVPDPHRSRLLEPW